MEIPLANGGIALIDEADQSLITERRWLRIDGSTASYAIATTRRGEVLFMHRIILKPRWDERVDHRNRNGLDNRRENLRIATPSQNAANRIPNRNKENGAKGVTFSRATGKWMAAVVKDGERIFLAYFDAFEEAVLAYNAAHSAAFGAFARPNPLPPTDRFEWLIENLGLSETQAGIIRQHVGEGKPHHEVAASLSLSPEAFAGEWEAIQMRVAAYQAETVRDEDQDGAGMLMGRDSWQSGHERVWVR